MTKRLSIHADYGLLFVMDHSAGEVPKAMGPGRIAATASCIAVGTLHAQEGETSVTLSDDALQIDDTLALTFDGWLETPEKSLAICAVQNDILIAIDVPSARTRVRIWTNDDSEPDQVFVLAGEGE